MQEMSIHNATKECRDQKTVKRAGDRYRPSTSTAMTIRFLIGGPFRGQRSNIMHRDDHDHQHRPYQQMMDAKQRWREVDGLPAYSQAACSGCQSCRSC